MAGNGGKKAKAATHAHERNMHPGKPLTKMPFKTNGNNNDNNSKPRGGRGGRNMSRLK
jgi:hypothetical protein